MLADLNQEERVNIVSKLQPRTFQTNDHVIREGDRVIDDAFYIITNGQAAVVQEQKNNKEENILTRLFEGHCFGEMALVGKSLRTANATATEATVCIVINGMTFQKELCQTDSVLAGLVRVMVGNIRSLHQNNLSRRCCHIKGPRV